MQLDGQVQSGLAAKGREEGVGAFASDNLGENLRCEGLDVGSVGNLGIRHDGGGVGVHEDHTVALVAQSATRLRPRVVELGGLPDDYGARTYDQDALYVVP